MMARPERRFSDLKEKIFRERISISGTGPEGLEQGQVSEMGTFRSTSTLGGNPMKKWSIMLSLMVVFIAVPVSVSLAAKSERIERLGKIMFQDANFSFNGTQACMDCHNPQSAFVDPENTADPVNSVVSIGADGESRGGRNAPTAAYAGFSPVLAWHDRLGGYVGGMFWDGRATGRVLWDPLAEQAQGPPLNPVEMNMPSKEAVIQVIRDSSYVRLFLQVFGRDSLDDVDKAYDNFGRAIAAFERTREVQKFSSAFDRRRLTAQQKKGWALFRKNCAKCHVAKPSRRTPALFTAYTYENIGLPANPLLPGNPPDYGLGGFLEADYNSSNPLIGDAKFADQYGKFKVPTLRNVALTPPYGHNGVFPTLREMVDFLNSRDNGTWPAPQVSENLNTTDVGNMGLTPQEVDDIVAFLNALTDT
jgi:cytochrome c peroxidase